MTDWNYESELAEKFELTAEQYWIDGMSLSDARRKASNEIFENGTNEMPVALPFNN